MTDRRTDRQTNCGLIKTYIINKGHSASLCLAKMYMKAKVYANKTIKYVSNHMGNNNPLYKEVTLANK